MAEGDGGGVNPSQTDKESRAATPANVLACSWVPLLLPGYLVRKEEPMAQPQNFFRTIEHHDAAAKRRLRELGLSVDGLHLVIEAGENARAQATAHDPKTASSHDAWRYRVRAMRDTFCVAPYDWKAGYDRGLEMIVSADDKRSIITRAGDRNVGLEGTHPQPKNEVGDVTAKRVSGNGSLFLDPDWMNIKKLVVSGSETWLLLVYRKDDTVMSELSLASGIADDGTVEGWIERICLPGIDRSDPSKKQAPQAPPAVDESDDVPVIRKRR